MCIYTYILLEYLIYPIHVLIYIHACISIHACVSYMYINTCVGINIRIYISIQHVFTYMYLYHTYHVDAMHHYPCQKDICKPWVRLITWCFVWSFLSRLVGGCCCLPCGTSTKSAFSTSSFLANNRTFSSYVRGESHQ